MLETRLFLAALQWVRIPRLGRCSLKNEALFSYSTVHCELPGICYLDRQKIAQQYRSHCTLERIRSTLSPSTL